jgi:hypothetical protein
VGVMDLAVRLAVSLVHVVGLVVPLVRLVVSLNPISRVIEWSASVLKGACLIGGVSQPQVRVVEERQAPLEVVERRVGLAAAIWRALSAVLVVEVVLGSPLPYLVPVHLASHFHAHWYPHHPVVAPGVIVERPHSTHLGLPAIWRWPERWAHAWL